VVSFGSEKELVTGARERASKTSGSVKGGKFIPQPQ
jgi:hypothetical protein